METLTVTLYGEDAEGDFEEVVKLPARYEVCPRCHGVGVHDHPAFSNGLTAEDFAEDPDFLEQYMDGRYDVACSVCDGMRVTLEVDQEWCDPVLFERYIAMLADQDAYRAEVEAERRMGA